MALLGPVPMKEKKVKGSILFTENLVALLPSNHRMAHVKTLKFNQLQRGIFYTIPRRIYFTGNNCRCMQATRFSSECSF